MKLTTLAKQAIRNIMEDWKFLPVTGGNTPVLDPSYTLAKLNPIDSEENVMPKYKLSKDNGTKKTEKAIRKIQRRNQHFSNSAKSKSKFNPYR